MTDILETLKALTDDPDTKVRLVRLDDIHTCIDEIARLRADRERLREGLAGLLRALRERGVGLDPMSEPTPMIELLTSPGHHTALEAARTALKETAHE